MSLRVRAWLWVVVQGMMSYGSERQEVMQSTQAGQ